MRKINTRIFFSFLLTSCVLFAVSDRIKSSQTEEHEAIVRLVLVDVVATDKEGNFVSDLKEEDLEVYENGKRLLEAYGLKNQPTHYLYRIFFLSPI